MGNNSEEISLSTLARGAAIERFDDELRRVLENISDPNTAGGIRSVTLTVKIKPNDERNFGDVSVACSSKVAAAKPVSSQIFIGKDFTGVHAFEHNPEQLKLDIAAGHEPIREVASNQ